MVSKFKSLSTLEEILARGAILGDNPNFGGNFILRGDSVRGTTRLLGMFFLTFFYYSFIYFFIYFIVLYIYYISYLIYSLIILFS